MYKSYVVPVLTYCSSVFSSCLLVAVDLLEGVTRYFTGRLWARAVSSSTRKDYLHRLTYFSLDSNEAHLLRLNLLLLFKVIRGFITIPSITIKFSPRVPHRIILNSVKSNILKNHFIHRASKTWNQIIRDDSFRSMSLPPFRCFVFSLNLTPFLLGRAFKAT